MLHCFPYDRKLVRKDAIGCCANTSVVAAGSLHLIRTRRPSVAARSRSYQEMQDLIFLGLATAHVLLRKRSALPTPNGWVVAGAAAMRFAFCNVSQRRASATSPRSCLCPTSTVLF